MTSKGPSQNETQVWLASDHGPQAASRTETKAWLPGEGHMCGKGAVCPRLRLSMHRVSWVGQQGCRQAEYPPFHGENRVGQERPCRAAGPGGEERQQTGPSQQGQGGRGGTVMSSPGPHISPPRTRRLSPQQHQEQSAISLEHPTRPQPPGDTSSWRPASRPSKPPARPGALTPCRRTLQPRGTRGPALVTQHQ